MGGKFEYKCIKNIIFNMFFFFLLKVSIMYLWWEFVDESFEICFINLNVMLKVIEYIRKVFMFICYGFFEWVIYKWSKIGGGCNFLFLSRLKFFK